MCGLMLDHMQTSLAKTYYQALERVLERLDARRGEWNEIAAQAKVPYGTVKNIGNRHIKSPNVDAVDALDRFLEKSVHT
jgi:hypothetical protein